MIKDGYTHTEAAVYSRLWRYWRNSKRNDVIYPSVESIADDIQRTPKQVQRSIRVLSKRWLIEVSRRWYKRRNNYYIYDRRNYPPEVGYNGE